MACQREGWVAYQRAWTTTDVDQHTLATAAAEASPAVLNATHDTADAAAAVRMNEVDPTADNATWLFLPERRLESDALPAAPADLQLWRTRRRPVPPPAATTGKVSEIPPEQGQQHVKLAAAPAGRTERFTATRASKAQQGQGGLRVALKAVSRVLPGKQRR